ncbi:hypothetical protein PybrP1_006821, partial [[Pythium] brassicae (nom. inval.)]
MATTAGSSTSAVVGDPLISDSNGTDTGESRSKRAFWTQVWILSGYGVMFLLCVALLAYMRVKRHD